MTTKIVLLAGAAIGLCGPAALATVTDPALVITATNAQGTASRTFLLADGIPSPTGGYTLNGVAPFQLIDTGNVIADVRAIQEEVSPESNIGPGNPNRNRITVGFTLWSGDFDTHITIESMNYGLAVPGGAARAFASASLTDRQSNGVFFTGNYGPPGGVGGLRYFTNGSEFTTLFPASFGTPTPGGSANMDAAQPPLGFLPIFPSANTMNFRWDFTISAGDEIAANANFLVSSIIPSPGALSLLALGGAVVGLRRRR